jgi:hypothetical protein
MDLTKLSGVPLTRTPETLRGTTVSVSARESIGKNTHTHGTFSFGTLCHSLCQNTWHTRGTLVAQPNLRHLSIMPVCFCTHGFTPKPGQALVQRVPQVEQG